MDSAILEWRAGVASGASGAGAAAQGRLEVSLVAHPRLESTRAPAQAFGPLIVFLATVLSFVSTVVRVTAEKERHIVSTMRSTGLRVGAYWTSHWVRRRVGSNSRQPSGCSVLPAVCGHLC